MTMYAIAAAVTRQETHKGTTWSSTRGLPTFYLNSVLQGIVDRAHAERLARRMLVDAAGPDVDIHVSAHPALPETYAERPSPRAEEAVEISYRVRNPRTPEMGPAHWSGPQKVVLSSWASGDAAMAVALYLFGHRDAVADIRILDITLLED